MRMTRCGLPSHRPEGGVDDGVLSATTWWPRSARRVGAQAEAVLPRRRSTAVALSWKRDRVGRCRFLAERRQRLSGVARCRTTFHRFAMSASEAMRVEDASQGLCRMRAASVSRRDSRGRDRALVATQLCQVGPPGRSGLTNSALVAQLRRGRCMHSSPSLRPAPVAIDRVPDGGP
jgi:hypothetical protein